MPTEFLKVEGLAKTYPGAAEPVFDGVNFNIAQGEFVCIDSDPATDAVMVAELPALGAPLRRNGLVLEGVHGSDDRDMPGRHQKLGLEQLVCCPRRHLPQGRCLYLGGAGFHHPQQQIHRLLTQ